MNSLIKIQSLLSLNLAYNYEESLVSQPHTLSINAPKVITLRFQTNFSFIVQSPLRILSFQKLVRHTQNLSHLLE